MSGFEAINYFNAPVKDGDDMATFVISLPNWSGLGSVNTRTLATPRSLHFTTTSDKKVSFEVFFWAELDKRHYPFTLMTDNVESNKAENVAVKLKDHFDTMAKELPLLTNLPRITYNTEDDDSPMFELNLPPRSAFYTTSDLLIKGLRFEKHPYLKNYNRAIGAKGRRAMLKRVYGFFNNTGETWTIRGGEMLPGVSMDAIIGQKAFPKSVLCQVEMTNTSRMRVPGPRGETRLQVASNANALRIWKQQLAEILTHLGLPEDTLTAEAAPNDSIIISNTVTPNAGLKVGLEFNAALTEVLDLTPGQQLLFNLAKQQNHVLAIKKTKEDPFFGLYPIMVRASAFSNAISWVDGIGEVTVFGIIDEKTSRHPIISTGLVFGTDKTRLTIQFYDKARRLITFKQGHNIGMLMHFRSI